MIRQQKSEATKIAFCLQQIITVHDKLTNETHVRVQKQENKTVVSLIISYVRDILYCLRLEMPDYKHEVSADHNE
jgi:hypothetical protein